MANKPSKAVYKSVLHAKYLFAHLDTVLSNDYVH